MTQLLVINPRAGTSAPNTETLVAAARERRIETHVLRPGESPSDRARSTGDLSALGVAGGDGSLAAVASVALERDVPFVCVPFGTRNHFARDLGLDRDDPLSALAAFDGEERRIDVGRVGERLFLNNVSLGAYAGLVHRRERHRRRRQALAGARALWRLVRTHHSLHVKVDGRPLSARIVLVANNGYELDLFNVGARTSLTSGKLHLYAARGWLPRSWRELVAEAFTVEGSAPLSVAIDGEPVELPARLEFTVEPRALRVLLPPPR
ncbi:MAG: hypothetical protein M3M94_07285 [Actinomycetota bacterium]|nr:hypothetical protein [Actinomycetota bacterium]